MMVSQMVHSRKFCVLGVAFSLWALLLLVTMQHFNIDVMINSPVLDTDLSNETVSKNGMFGTKSRRLPQAIIIGVRKSGTRALARFLEINPDIKAAQNEVHYFDRLENYQLGLEWYRNQMPPTDDGQITIEKSPAYFVTKKVPERIKAMNASVKLIVIMRDPVTRLISDFSQLLANRLKSHTFNWDDIDYDSKDADTPEVANENYSMISSQLAGRELEKLVLRKDGGIDEHRRIVRTGMYAVHLERWISVFPREQFHFVDGERLIKEPHVELQKLELFLGFRKPTIKKEEFIFSPKKGFYCLANKKYPIRDKRQTNSMDVTNERYESIVPVCLGKSKGRRHVPMGRSLSDKLRSFYAPYNEYLSSLTGLQF